MVTRETYSRDYIDPITQTRIYLDANSSPIVLWECTPSNYSKLMFDPSSFVHSLLLPTLLQIHFHCRPPHYFTAGLGAGSDIWAVKMDIFTAGMWLGPMVKIVFAAGPKPY